MDAFRKAPNLHASDAALQSSAAALASKTGQPLAECLAAVRRTDAARVAEETVWINSKYQVNMADAAVGEGFPDMIHLSIKRRDKEAIHDWRDLQKIKNALVGEEHEGVELYPAESDLIDSANQMHIFVLKQKGLRFPFGFRAGRYVLDAHEAPMGVKQRAFDE